MPDPTAPPNLMLLAQLLRAGAPGGAAADGSAPDPNLAALVQTLMGGASDGNASPGPAADPGDNPFAALGVQPPMTGADPHAAIVAALLQGANPPPFQTPAVEDDSQPPAAADVGAQDAPSASDAATDAATTVGPDIPRRANWDPIVERYVAAFNKENGADPGDDVYLDPDWIKAMIMREGNSPKAFSTDPMQVNTDRWDAYKGALGLTRGQAPGPDLSIRAGIRWLEEKAYEHDGNGRVTKFKTWPQAIRDYNGGGDANYWPKVLANYQYLKAGGR